MYASGRSREVVMARKSQRDVMRELNRRFGGDQDKVVGRVRRG
jgi:hypothetical protein